MQRARRRVECLGTPKDPNWTPHWTHETPAPELVVKAYAAALYALESGLPLGYLHAPGGLRLGGSPERLEPAGVWVGLGYSQKEANYPIVEIDFQPDGSVRVFGGRNYEHHLWSEPFTEESWPRIREWLAQPAKKEGRKER